MSPLLMSLVAGLMLIQAPEPGPSPELIDRFIASLPPAETQLDEVDSAELNRLTRLNPGRGADIRPILEAHARCTAPGMRAALDRMMRTVAGSLRHSQVEAMVRLYEGPDLPLFARLSEKANRTAAEDAEIQRLLRSYPVEAFGRAMQIAMARIGQDEEFLQSLATCAPTKIAELNRAGLRTSD